MSKMNINRVRWTCDRCDEYVDINVRPSRPNEMPSGWSTLAMTSETWGPLSKEYCNVCDDVIRKGLYKLMEMK